MEVGIYCPKGGRHVVDALRARLVVDDEAEPLIALRCPGCGAQVARPVDLASAIRLVVAGLRGFAPAEGDEIAEAALDPGGPPDLHRLVVPSDWRRQLERDLVRHRGRSSS